MTKSINGSVVPVLCSSFELSLSILLRLDLTPRMLQNLVDIETLGNIAIQHAPDEIYALLAKDERYPEVSIHDLIDAIKGVLLVYDCVKEDTQRPNILLLAAVRFSSQDLRSSVIYFKLV